ncbi:MAG: GNAT family N-acetyltransferase [Anaerolineae bacterium]|jgi:GNAT superfamily N-acetyltransferase|nr:GNAT family N-acetyltransferase [Anaerolineae bacterium]
MIIRTATEDDAEAIGQMWERLVAYHHALDPALPPAARGGGKVYAKRILQRLNDPLTRILVAQSDEQLVGYVLAVIVDIIPDMFVQENSGFLADIYVEDTHRRHGVGRGLVAAIQAWLTENHIASMEWHVAHNNTAGRAFWEAVGGRGVLIRMRADLTEQGG